MIDNKLFNTIGLMSGTSMDGIDAALIQTDGYHHVKHIDYTSLAYTKDFQLLLKAAEQSFAKAEGEIHCADALLKEQYACSFAEITKEITGYHYQVVLQLLKKTDQLAKDIDVIGFHGQTLWHNPAKGKSVQIGSGEQLAKATSIQVVDQFRQNDIQHGGQGAPLVPLYHQALAVRDQRLPLIVANCGGIANITYVSGQGESEVWGFDTGPGNVLLDRLVRERTKNKEMLDYDGRYGLQGKVHLKILHELMDSAVLKNGQNYLLQTPPKSLDSQDCRLIKALNALSLPDACATLAAFTAKTLVLGANLLNMPMPKAWVLVGGGWRNPVIKAELQSCLEQKLAVLEAAEIAWHSQAMEAECFAYLAVRHLLGLPLSVPQTTGVQKPTTGGVLHLPC